MIKGIDVSRYQGSIDWAKVKADGVKFAFIKATQGTVYKYIDYFTNNAPKALGCGVEVGAYHYGTFSNVAEAKAEARYFLSVVKPFKLTYPLVLDLEENEKRVTINQLTDAAIAFLEEIENAGYFAMLYSGKSFFENWLDESRLKSYALWIARYGPELGRKADIWQYSSKGAVWGINGNVDMNVSYRDFASEIRAMRHIAYPGHSFKKGSKGNEVKMIQKIVGAVADGIFGPKTESAVKAWQKSHGLVADGIVGPLTWDKMF